MKNLYIHYYKAYALYTKDDADKNYFLSLSLNNDYINNILSIDEQIDKVEYELKVEYFYQQDLEDNNLKYEMSIDVENDINLTIEEIATRWHNDDKLKREQELKEIADKEAEKLVLEQQKELAELKRLKKKYPNVVLSCNFK